MNAQSDREPRHSADVCEDQAEMLEMFTRAWDGLSPEEQREERAERERWLAAYSNMD
jgi:hypothetical protein